MLIGQTSHQRPILTDLALELVEKAAAFRRSLSGTMLKSLADLVWAMNCYYRTLIEGHDTRPIDIERSLNNQ